MDWLVHGWQTSATTLELDPTGRTCWFVSGQAVRLHLRSLHQTGVKSLRFMLLVSREEGIESPLGSEIPGGGAVPFWRWRVCKAQKTPFFSIAVTHRPHIFYSCMSSHPKTHIFSFNLSLNAPWFEKLAFEKNTMYFFHKILNVWIYNYSTYVHCKIPCTLEIVICV